MEKVNIKEGPVMSKRFEVGHDYNNGELYGPAMEIRTEGEAREYFADLVEYYVDHHKKERGWSVVTLKSNLAYWAGYYNDETRERVELLFACSHPIFGKASDGTPTPEEAFAMGKAFASKAE